MSLLLLLGPGCGVDVSLEGSTSAAATTSTTGGAETGPQDDDPASSESSVGPDTSASSTTGGPDSATTMSASGSETSATDSEGDTSSTGPDPSGSSTGSAASPFGGFGLEGSAVWDVPHGPGGYDWRVGPGSFAGQHAHRVLDLDGGALELVVTGEHTTMLSAFGLASGTDHWRVYRLETDGFTSEPELWALPDGVRPGGFAEAVAVPQYDEGWGWETFDLDRDGWADLVVTSVVPDAGIAATPGYPETPHWNVYFGGPGGFEPTSTPWSLPQGGQSTPNADHGLGFDSIEAFETTAPTDQAWVTRDVDADGDLDLVVVRRRDEEGEPLAFQDTASGFGNWRVYRGDGTGFATEVEYWDLPPTPDGGQWFQDTTAVATDFNDDGRLDWVATWGANLPLGGDNQRWDVHVSDGGGLAAAPIAWSVPEVEGQPWGFFDLADIYRHRVLDMDADGWPDLLMSSNPISGSVWGLEDGEPYWALHRGGPTGFAQEPTRWEVPPIDLDGEGLRHFENFVISGTRVWTEDIDGDGIIDLVFPAGAQGNPDLPSEWRIYAGSLGG